MGARVEKLVEEDSEVRGVYYRGQDGWHEVRALLTVAADGRFSRVRRLAGFEPIKTAPPMDVLWFRLPRRPGDPEESGGRISAGHILVVLNRSDYWQVGYGIPKGGYQKIRAAGLDALRQEIARIEPAIQGFQSIMQKQALGRVFTSDKPLTIPLFLRFLLRLPVVRTLPARFIGLGFWPVHVKNL